MSTEKQLMPLSPAVRAVVDSLSLVGAEMFFVGGAVRDALLGLPNVDLDLEVYLLPPDKLEEVLAQHGRVSYVGASFGVFKLTLADRTELDVSLPRRETVRPDQLGEHRGFDIEADAVLDPADASARRDYTINTLMWNPVTNLVEDYHGGLVDLGDKILRHTSEHFREDPLRVLRGMQFCARFNLKPANETLQECLRIVGLYHKEPLDRVWHEWEKMLLSGSYILRGIHFLHQSGWMAHYPELLQLTEFPKAVGPGQAPTTLLAHAVLAADNAARLCTGNNITGNHRMALILAALLHSAGQPLVSALEGPAEDRASAQAILSGVQADSFLRRIKAPAPVVELVLPLIRHQHIPEIAELEPSNVRRLAVDLAPASIALLELLLEALNSADLPGPWSRPALGWLLAAEQEGISLQPPKRLLMGRHLKAHGLEHGPTYNFTLILDKAFEAQLQGEFSRLEGALEWLNGYLDGAYPDDLRAFEDSKRAVQEPESPPVPPAPPGPGKEPV